MLSSVPTRARRRAVARSKERRAVARLEPAFGLSCRDQAFGAGHIRSAARTGLCCRGEAAAGVFSLLSMSVSLSAR